MKSKIISVSVFILLAYVIPLLGDPEMLYFWKIGVLSVFTVILFFTQPPIRISEALENRSADKLSVAFILTGFLLSQAAIVFEWAYLSVKLTAYPGCQCIAGFILMILGTGFRAWSIHTLGQFFTATVQVRESQQIVTHGPYSLVRHPGYFGAYLAAIGSAMFMQVSLALILTMIILFLAYMFRIQVEERALTREFGNQYTEYKKRTKKLIPFIY